MDKTAKREPWRTTLGILGIIFGCFALFGALQTFFLPTMLEWQHKMFETISSSGNSDRAAAQMNQFVKEMFPAIPEWFAVFSMIMGFIGVLVASFYLFAAIWLIIRKAKGPKLFCGALVVSIAYALAKNVGIASALGKWGLMMALGGIFGVFLDLILLIVLLVHRSRWEVKDGLEQQVAT